jgi:UDP-2,3-diacylglucosamine pyrophosphatase LpxH
MGNMKKIKIALLLCTVLFYCSCDEDTDFSGYIYSPDPVNERVKQSLDWNKSHPASEILVSGTGYSLLIAGDIHAGGTVNLDSFLTQANTPDISGLVIVGDLTSGHREDFEIFNEELESKNSCTAFLMIGNHDLFFNGWDTYFNLFGSSTYSFTIRTDDTTDLYICLDSGGGTHGWRQMEWLKDLLKKERKNARYCVLFTHNNFFRTRRTGSTNPLVDELRAFMDLCYKNSVNMVIMGHDHKRSEEFLGRTRYVTLDALQDDSKDASYMKLQVKENDLVYTFIALK